MRLSTVFELLLIFLFIAFAASRHVGKKHAKNELQSRQENAVVDAAKPTTVPNRYCQCANLMCNCCRDFSLPVVSLKGPGCARITYLNGDSMRLTMSFGDRVFRNITLTGKKPSPVCMGLPGGLSKFCGRVYGIQKEGETFKACLALELRALDDVEAALRVSCFKFGPQGVKLEPGKPVPASNNEDEDDDDDDDDDDYGLSDDDDDDDDDDVDFGLSDDDDDEDNDVDSGDYTGFSALSDEFLDGFFGSSGNKKKKKPTQIQKSTTSASVAKPIKTTGKPLIPTISTLKTVSKLTSEYTTKAPSTETMKVEQSTEPTIQGTSVQMNVKVVQDGVKISDSTPSMTTMQEEMTEGETSETYQVTQGESNLKEATTQMAPVDVKQETEEPEDSSEEEEETEKESEESEEESAEESAATERGNILDGILGDDENEDDKEEDEDDDDEEDFRQLRSYVPKGNYKPMTQEEQEKKFPGLSALIRPSPYNSFPRERMIPVLSSYFPTPTQDYSSFAFPPVRSARQHKRMRLPPLKS